MSMLWLLLCAGAVLGETIVGPVSKVVTIKQGPVRGYKLPESDDVFAYYNIPYATAPTGPDKFKAPLPPPNWTEPFEAVSKQVVCPQPLPFVNGQEDCLIANVFAPEDRTNLPVMVYVHGGAYQYGAGDESVTKLGINSIFELIVVNFNYRLGVHGFLCLGTEDAPGNAGMKDQLALLRWVKENIQVFGGNPDDVTIVGCSAGGASVDLLRLVSVTDGLFAKVIAESGANAGSFGIQHNPLQNAKSYARELGFKEVDDIDALANFYTTASFETLFLRSDLVTSRPDSSVMFAPCVEKDIGIERFLDDAPVNILKRGSNKALPVLYGFANLEGMMRIPQFVNWSSRMNEDFSEFLPADLAFESSEEKEAVAKQIKEFYFGDRPVSVDTIESYIDYFSDTLFVYSILRSVKLNAESGNNSTMFLYEYSYPGLNSNLPGGVTGALHCQQIEATFDGDESNMSEQTKAIRAKMRRLYSDFISTGTPTSEGSSLPVWGPADVNRNPHMTIGSIVSIEGPLHELRAKLWDEIYEKYYRSPIPPSSPVEQETSNVVTIKQGPVRGYKLPGSDDVYAYYSIPYATAPTGPNKFKAPLPPPNWTEPFEAIDMQISCPQDIETVNDQEDCLIANIFAPKNRTNLPVMVYVHGGAYQFGIGQSETKLGINSISELIVVNFNYRLGVHGFLCLGTEEAPGNAGMKDQLALLRWVKENIQAFGGNPDDVTIVGCSAGGTSVDLLRLVSVTNGLFAKVIAESGANAGPFSVQHNPLENAKGVWVTLYGPVAL